MKGFHSLAYCFLGLSSNNLVQSRYTISAKIEEIISEPLFTEAEASEALQNDAEQELLYATSIHGKILSKGSKIYFENSEDKLENNIDNPCYLYFSEDIDVNVNFAYFYDGFPLQVTPRHIFFWPNIGSKNFSLDLQSDVELDSSNTALYCGDLSDILGMNAIESERAESIRLGSFPEQPFGPLASLRHSGNFVLTSPILDTCQVEIHFPEGHAPKSLKFREQIFKDNIEMEIKNSGRSFIFKGFNELTNNDDTKKQVLNKRVEFDLQYKSFDQIAYSYDIVTYVNCNYHGRDMDQYDLVQILKAKSADNA